MLPARKVTSFPFNHAEQSDKPAFTNSADLKAAFDSRSETVRAAHNGLIDDLTSVTPGSSGAEQLGSAPIAGVAGDTPHEQMTDLKAQVNTADGKAVTAQENLALHSGSAAIHTTQAEKDKLAGIQSGAEVNQSAFSKVVVAGQADIDADNKTDALTLAGGTGITVTTDPATDKVTITATGEAVPGAHASSHITGGADVIPNAVAGGNSGLMSGADKAVSDNRNGYGVTAGTATDYTAVINPAPTLQEGLRIAVKIHAENTGAATINVNGLGAKSIKKANGNDVSAGNLKAGSVYSLIYSGLNFILQGEGGSGNAVAADLLLNKTAETDAGPIVGSMQNLAGTFRAAGWTNGNADMAVDVQIPAAGYYDTAAALQINDPDLIPSNIKSGIDIFGVPGALIVGKRFASGTLTSPAVVGVSVTGLAFAPAYVIAKYQIGNNQYEVDYSTFGFNISSRGREFNTSTLGWTVSGANNFVVGPSNFSFNSENSGAKTVNWFAFE